MRATACAKILAAATLALIASGFAAPALAATTPAAAASASVAVGPIRTGVDDFTFQSMNADYTLGRAEDGTSTLRVVETFVAVFPDADQNHGLRRSIPDSYKQQPLFPELVSITDGDGRTRESETKSNDGDFVMTSRADGFVRGPQTYVFTYMLRNVTGTFADTRDDEFYWDVNGVQWSQPFGEVTATLHVDGALAQALTGQQACYQGREKSTQQCDISADAETDGATTVTAGASDLGPNETMTIAVGFRKDTFTPFDSSYLASPWGWLQGVAGLGLLGALVFAIVARVRKLSDAPGRPTIIAEYTPPRGVDALQSAVLLGSTTKAIPAEVLEQAVVGSIRIVEGGKKFFGGVKLQAELIDRSRSDGDGRMLLRGLFGGDKQPGAIFEFGSTDRRFSAAAQKILLWANEELVRSGLRRKVSGWTRALPLVIAIAAAVLVIVLGLLAMGAGVDPGIPVVLMGASIVIVVTVGIFLSRKPLTAAGAEVRDHLAGLKEFIEWAEADRIRMLQSPAGAERVQVDVDDPRQMLKLYEVLLPYAVVFGQEKQWAAELAVLYGADVAPYWYVGTHGFNASSFSAGIGSLSASASSSSSTSGGSGGGGSAGGGGGGGGGGGV